jgi:hypothetical protein
MCSSFFESLYFVFIIYFYLFHFTEPADILAWFDISYFQVISNLNKLEYFSSPFAYSHSAAICTFLSVRMYVYVYCEVLFSSNHSNAF